MIGMRIIENWMMVDRIQNRKHRKSRINKKWAKKYGFTEVPKKDVYIVNGSAIMHPTVAAEMRKKLRVEKGKVYV